ncbi:MAG: putative Hybrid histidine kinase, partial [Deltaproteobacteria bacterium]|nr:putative Hybrid histidine kinase [Deltaproteobacteria bacterium]
MKKKLKILNLEDNPSDHELIRAKLEEEGIEHEMTRVETREAFLDEIEKGGLDLILADNKLPTFDGLSALEIVIKKDVETPF